MIKNYILSALRSIKNNKTFSVINIFGLIFSMAICLLVITFCVNIFNTDNFHKNKDHIYRVTSQFTSKNIHDSYYATTSYPIVSELVSSSPQIKQVTYIRRLGGTIKDGDNELSFNGFYTNSSLFKSFDFSLKKGNSDDLDNPFTVYLSENFAEKLFGNMDIVGKQIQINDLGSFEIKGIIKKASQPTHLKFDVLVSFISLETLEIEKIQYPSLSKWKDVWHNVAYLELNNESDKELVENRLNKIAEEKCKDEDFTIDFKLQNLKDISPGKVYNNEIGYIIPYVGLIGITILALVILAISGFNYLNLTYAKSLTKSREIGIRKVFGSSRKQIMFQYIVESSLLLVISFLLATILFEYGYKMAARYIPELHNEVELKRNYLTYIIFFIFTLGTGTIFGMIASFRISNLNPIKSIKDNVNIKLLSKLGIRRVLIVLQFIISTTFIIGTILTFKQLILLNNMDFGFNKENIISVDLQNVSFEVYKKEIESINGITAISTTRHMPVSGTNYMTSVAYSGISDTLMSNLLFIDHIYIDLFDIKLIAGRNYTINDGIGNERYIIVNQETTKKLGFSTPIDALGEYIHLGSNKDLEIIGVTNNFKYKDPFSKVDMLLMSYNPEQIQKLILKYSNITDKSKLINELKSKWESIEPNVSFEYKTYEETLDVIYKPLKSFGLIVALLSILTITISTLGLLGMIAYQTKSSAKNIAIHKVLGANYINVIKYLTKSYLKVLVLSISVSIIILTGVITVIKQQLPYSIGFDIPSFFIGILIILTITLLTILSQTFKASRTNPVEALRYE